MDYGKQSISALDEANLNANEWHDSAAPHHNKGERRTAVHEQYNAPEEFDNISQHDPRALGNRAIFSPEPTIPDSPNQEPIQITPAIMPPGYEQYTLESEKATTQVDTTQTSTAPSVSQFSFDPQHTMHGDSLSAEAKDALEGYITEFNATGNAEHLADELADARAKFQGREVA